jgi:toxin ParE1/3/4
MLELLLSPKAEQDLSEIYKYTFEEWREKQADRYQDDLFLAMQTIRNKALLGKAYVHSDMPYRILHVNRHLIFYRVDENKYIVVRVLHDRMNLKAHL